MRNLWLTSTLFAFMFTLSDLVESPTVMIHASVISSWLAVPIGC